MDELVDVEGQQIQLTNMDKVLWPKEKITKAELINYYVTVAPQMLPFIRDRPLSLYRFPHGIEDRLGFVQKNWPHFPEWVKTFRIKSERGTKTINYLLCNDLPTLVWLVNMSAIEINQFLSTVPKVDNPDIVLFDLDPKYPADFAQTRKVAHAVHATLRELGLKHLVKTSGAEGIHILVSVKPRYNIERIREFVKRVGDIIASVIPKLATTSRDPREQAGKVYIDYRQNGTRMVIAAPYSVRPIEGAPVSCPIEPKRLEESSLGPEEFTLRRIVEDPSSLLKVAPESTQKLERAFQAVGLEDS